MAFDAQVVIRGGAGERTIPISDFFHAPDATDRRMTALLADEIVTAILLPELTADTRSAYVKAMDRAAWAFALAGAAVRIEIRDGTIQDVRVVLGGVAPTPWREFRVEKALSGAAWNEAMVTQAAMQALADAQPLEHNAYKVRLARAMVKRALGECL